jgi:hypothetical protein
VQLLLDWMTIYVFLAGCVPASSPLLLTTRGDSANPAYSKGAFWVYVPIFENVPGNFVVFCKRDLTCPPDIPLTQSAVPTSFQICRSYLFSLFSAKSLSLGLSPSPHFSLHPVAHKQKSKQSKRTFNASPFLNQLIEST